MHYAFKHWAEFVEMGGFNAEHPLLAPETEQTINDLKLNATDLLKLDPIDALTLDNERVNEEADTSDSEDDEKVSKTNDLHDPCRYGNSLFVFGPDNSFRQACGAFVSWPKFDHFILFCIGFNSVTMALERPSIEDDSLERKIISISGFMFMAIFFMEFCLKIVAWGVFFGPTAYFKNVWNRLDGFLVSISAVDFLFIFVTISAPDLLDMLRILRLLRALRPLRVINRAPKLKQVVNTLILSMGMIGDTFLIAAIVFLIFGILSVQLFAGTLFYCSASDSDDAAEGLQGHVGADEVNGLMITVLTKGDCISIGGEWINQTYNYDNLFNALLTLFYVSSFDGWVDVLFYSIDAVGVDLHPVEDANEAAALFFVSFLIIANFFILNMFVGIIVDSFQMTQTPDEERQRILLMKRQERRQQKTDERYEYCLKVYRMGFGNVRNSLVALVESNRFDMFITMVIVFNVGAMMSEFHGQPVELTDSLAILNYVFTGIFAAEAALKLHAFGVTCYFSNTWNKFDFFIVIMSFVGLIIDHAFTSDAVNPVFIRCLRMARIARIMKLIKAAEGLRILMETTFKSLAQVANVGLLLFLFFFIYAAAGVEMFGKLGCKRDVNECQGISEHANFENFFIAMLTLFRIWTGDNGNGILKDALRVAPECNAAQDCKENCCVTSPILAIAYFLSFTVIAQFILLNVVVAVLMAQLEESTADEERRAEAVQKGDKDRPSSSGSWTFTEPPESRCSPMRGGSPSNDEGNPVNSLRASAVL